MAFAADMPAVLLLVGVWSPQLCEWVSMCDVIQARASLDVCGSWDGLGAARLLYHISRRPGESDGNGFAAEMPQNLCDSIVQSEITTTTFIGFLFSSLPPLLPPSIHPSLLIQLALLLAATAMTLFPAHLGSG